MTERKVPDEPGFELFTSPYHEQRVLSCPEGTLVYQLAERDDPIALLKHHLRPGDIDQKIREILAANPNVEFTPELQAALGITIISYQKTSRSSLGEDIFW